MVVNTDSRAVGLRSVPGAPSFQAIGKDQRMHMNLPPTLNEFVRQIHHAVSFIVGNG